MHQDSGEFTAASKSGTRSVSLPSALEWRRQTKPCPPALCKSWPAPSGLRTPPLRLSSPASPPPTRRGCSESSNANGRGSSSSRWRDAARPFHRQKSASSRSVSAESRLHVRTHSSSDGPPSHTSPKRKARRPQGHRGCIPRIYASGISLKYWFTLVL